MKSPNSHLRNKKRDEYYTTLEEVKFIFEEIIREDFTGKTIYCPFDKDNSNFVIYLEHHNELNYKQLWHTSDDFRNHEDLIEQADYIISNPPFSLLVSDILPMMKKYDKKFFLFGGLMTMTSYAKFYSPVELKFIKRPNFNFYSLHEDRMQYVDGLTYMTNINVNEKYKECININEKFLTKTLNNITHVYDKDGYLTIDALIDFPNDYYEPVRCPITCFQYKYNKYFDYILYKRKDVDGWPYSDGKIRYSRALVKRKIN